VILSLEGIRLSILVPEPAILDGGAATQKWKQNQKQDH
jgi:hypothetical protein